MTRVLTAFASSAPACLCSIVVGVGIMLSVANLDLKNIGGIALRHGVGGVCLLAPAVAQRWRE